MIFEPQESIGLDKQILVYQKSIDKYLSRIWLGTIEVFGRVEVIDTVEGKYYSAWNKNTNEYYPHIFANDKVSATIGFALKGKESIRLEKNIAKMEVIITGRTNDIYGSSNKLDEKAYIDFTNALYFGCSFKELKNINLGIDKVFSGFNNDKLRTLNIAPWFVYSFEIEFTYFN